MQHRSCPRASEYRPVHSLRPHALLSPATKTTYGECPSPRCWRLRAAVSDTPSNLHGRFRALPGTDCVLRYPSLCFYCHFCCAFRIGSSLKLALPTSVCARASFATSKYILSVFSFFPSFLDFLTFGGVSLALLRECPCLLAMSLKKARIVPTVVRYHCP